MPSFKNTASLIVMAAGLAAATPGAVYMCTGANWSGTCQYYAYPLNECFALSGTTYADAQSFGPDSGATCSLYSNSGCTGSPSATLSSPGNANLGAWAQSFECTSSTSSSTSTGSTSSSGTTYSGTGTIYYQDGVAGSCGQYNSDSAYVVALSESFMDNEYDSPYCGRTISATNTATGVTIQVTVADTCPGCSADSVDFSVGAWDALTYSASPGTFPLTWYFN